MGMAMKLRDYLNSNSVPFEVLNHAHSSTSMQAARASKVPADRLAKAVVVEDDRHCMMAVLPASRRLRMHELEASNGRTIRLATETELTELFKDCEPGAVPPVGLAYGMETILDDSLMSQRELYFEAGDHETLVHMKTGDFLRMMKESRHMPISEPIDEDRGPLF
jgi:Ala-tRNA(Pro) deacylase